MVAYLLLTLLACKAEKGPGSSSVDTDAGVETGGASNVDADGDGFFQHPEGGDCDDADASVHPEAEERCGDGVDQDCDGIDLACNGLVLADSHRELSGVAKEQLFGHAVAFLPAHRVIAVGSPGVDANGGDMTFEGAVDFFSTVELASSPEAMSESSVRQVLGEERDSILGIALAAGDLGGDEAIDLVAAAPGNLASFSDEADGVYIFWDVDADDGDLFALETTLISLPTDSANPEFGVRAGWDLGIASNVDADGTVGVTMGVTGGCRLGGEGGVMVVAAPELVSGQLEADQAEFVGEKPCWTNYGYHDVGDLDGDGITDLVTAARSGGSKVDTIGGEYASDGMGPGYIYVVHGPLVDGGYLADADGRIEGAHAQALMGRAVGVSQDLDGDGYPEVLAGATWEDHAEEKAGSAYVIPGPDAARYAPAGDVATVHVQGDEEDLWLGYQVADGGDQDADGHRELLVTSMRADSSGEVAVFRGPLAGTLTRDDAVLRMVGTAPSYNLGSYPNEAGGLYAGFDLNDDGYDDWIAGARRNDAEGIGSLHVMFGGVWEPE